LLKKKIYLLKNQKLKKMSNQRSIETYLKGALSQTEKQQFEAALDRDDDLYVAVETERSLQLAGLQQRIERTFAAEAQKKQWQSINRRKFAAGFLLCGLFSTIYVWYLKKPEELKVFGNPTASVSTEPKIGENAAVNPATEPQFGESNRAHAGIATHYLNLEESKDPMIQAVIQSIRDETLQQSTLKIKELEKQQAQLASYLKALLYLKWGQKEAKIVLQKIKETPNHPKQAVANEILTKI
jgi:hypothetical protein